jgi:hypothetical protein
MRLNEPSDRAVCVVARSWPREPTRSFAQTGAATKQATGEDSVGTLGVPLERQPSRTHQGTRQQNRSAIPAIPRLLERENGPGS